MKRISPPTRRAGSPSSRSLGIWRSEHPRNCARSFVVQSGAAVNFLGGVVVVIALQLVSTKGRESGLPAREGLASRQEIRRRISISVDERIKIDTLGHVASPASRPLRTLFFKTDAGNEPVREWLLDLSLPNKKAIGADILAVLWKWPVGKPLVDSLGGGLWEVRSSLGERIARTFFIVVDEEIILLHGIIKK